MRRRSIGILIVVGVIILVVVLDRFGVFGHYAGDLNRYHLKTFPIVKVVDGDTIDVDCPDGRRRSTRIRLWGIDCPELLSEPFGPMAAEYTRSLLKGQKVTLILDSRCTRGKYGRLLAYITLPDARMVNEELIRVGLAWADPRFPHPLSSRFARIESISRKRRLGMWSPSSDNPTSSSRERYQ